MQYKLKSIHSFSQFDTVEVISMAALGKLTGFEPLVWEIAQALPVLLTLNKITKGV